MAHSYQSALDESLINRLNSVKVLMVGAGGIGCELIKNLILTGFTDVELIDLDTIDVSNLNRQFLFRKEHVGKSKAMIAREGALSYNPDAKILAHHDSIMNSKYGIEFFKRFALVMNALDNRAARNHVNRMCLAADVPLVESGTAGYLGQVTVIKKGRTECYECQPKPTQKTFPGCTIRNTPSEHIHCIVWAKHLFNQLFGEEDPDQDVSPDTEDPEAAGEAGDRALKTAAKADADASGGLKRVSTRMWAKDTSYSAEKLFTKLFGSDIKYLLSMENLWKKRRPPVPLDWNMFAGQSSKGQDDQSDGTGLRDQVVWSLGQCVHVFEQSLAALAVEFDAQGDGAMLAWDKDNAAHMDFVSAVANIRAHIFGIGLKSKFDIKAMAGNIIPAIATTNAVIAGLIVMEALKILSGQIDQCKTMYLNKMPNAKKKLIVPCVLDQPNPKCYVCSARPEVTVVLNTETMTVKAFEDKVVKAALGMVAPDVEIDDGQGTILVSSEEGETEENAGRLLSEFSISSGTRLKADDFLQEYNLVINIVHSDKLDPTMEFDIIGSAADMQPKAASENTAGASNALPEVGEENDDDLLLVEDEEIVEAPATADRKRKASQLSDGGDADAVTKKLKAPPSNDLSEDGDDLIIL